MFFVPDETPHRMFEFLDNFKRNSIWSIAIYIENGDFSFQKKIKSPELVLDSKRLRIRKRHIHTYADPFLFPFNDELFLFFESQAVSEHGRIEVIKTADLKKFESLGEVLKEPFHLSYPFVFECGSSVFMIPESYAANKVVLYKFEEFPNKLIRSRVLLNGGYWDSSAIKHNGVWFLFTTSSIGLEIFYTDDLENGRLTAHPLNPITTDPKYSRCGGCPLVVNDELCRIAQDGSGEYGRNIHILRINELSETAYDEEIISPDYFELNESWNSGGGHHFSLAKFKGKSIIAVDGKQNDFLLNRLLAIVN